MTKQFTTHCFIQKNTPELRAKLKEIGYCILALSGTTALSTINDRVYGYYLDVLVPEDIIGFVDCGENEQLFLALAAMNDSDDKDQLCIVNAPIFMFNKLKGIVEPENKKRYQVKGNFFKCLVPYKGSIRGQFIGYANPIIRKATVPEIIEHFKTKEK